jgi:sulfur relay (sulfurtransferase) complex TusBCD TusD component (DsrE family)
VRLGILVNTDRHAVEVAGLARAALARGHAVEIFAMDDGVRTLADPALAGLAALPGVAVSYCDLSLRQRGVDPAALPAAFREGSQYDNARMNQAADRVIVL